MQVGQGGLKLAAHPAVKAAQRLSGASCVCKLPPIMPLLCTCCMPRSQSASALHGQQHWLLCSLLGGGTGICTSSPLQ